MKSNLVLVALIPLLGLSVVPEGKAWFAKTENCNSYKYSSSQLFKAKVDSVVVITTDESQGSGFVVKQEDNNTYILTNAHVVGNKKRVSIKWSNEEEDNAEVIGNLGGDKLDSDLALLRIDGIKGNPITFSENLPFIGDDAVVIGAPSGLEFSLTRGVVSQIRENGKFVQIDAPVNPGNSGGPVFAHTGCVIGIVTFKAADNSEGLNFAIGNKLVKKFLKNPIIDEEAIARANTLKAGASASNYVELWNGIHTGMSVAQVKQKLGGDIECKKAAAFSWQPIDVTCFKRNPKVSIAELNFVVNVSFQGDRNDNEKQVLRDITLASVDHFYCPNANYSSCSQAYLQESRDQKNLLKIRDVIRRRYGQEETKRFQELVSKRTWYGTGKKIELSYNSTGILVVRYIVDEAVKF